MKKNNILKNLLNFSIGPLGAAVINFLTIPLITHMVTPEEYGKTAVFMLLQTLILTVGYLGMDQSFVREFNQANSKRDLFFNSYIFPFSLSLILSIVLFLFSSEISILIFSEDNPIVIQAFSLWIPFVVIERFILLYIRMEEKGLTYSIFNIVVKISIFICTLILLTFFGKTYTHVIVANVIGQVISDIFLIILCRKYFIKSYLPFSKKLLVKMFKYGLPFIPTTLLIWFVNSTDRISLERFSNSTELGIYFAALKVIGVFVIFQNIFSTFWIPLAFRWEKEGVGNESYTKVSRVLTFIMSLIFIIILSAKDLFVLILSEEYSDIVSVIPFLIFYPIMFTVAESTGLGISFARKTHYNIWIWISLFIVNIILNILLVPSYSALGAAIAYGVTYILYFWIKTIISRILWYKFSLRYYVFQTIILTLVSIINILLKSNEWVYIINFLFIITILVGSKDIVKDLKLKQVKKLVLRQKL
ncbi:MULTISPECIES: lipopolysaccharide biosynthesis protein [Bacillati]|uniref:lipopolysaccharide biosynthesis protein n=1 Tax=Bacillati TaxID=1783272 RepID=UPI0015F4D6F0|nr:oligosaccharide flippase family protein [Niallia taxi]MED3964052.1 oligosaccharide flippase family protein [Niallia taxi]